MSLPLDARGETPSSPQELVAAAKFAADRFLESRGFTIGKKYTEFYAALRAAYSAVVGDEGLRIKYDELVNQTLDAMPSVGSGRVARDEAIQGFRIDMTTPIWPLALVAQYESKRDIDRERDILWLLEKAIAPDVQAK